MLPSLSTISPTNALVGSLRGRLDRLQGERGRHVSALVPAHTIGHGEQSLLQWGAGREQARTTDGAHLRVAKVLHGPTQIRWIRQGIVIEKINPFTARLAEGGVALDGRVMAAGHDDFQPIARIIQLPAGRDCFDLGLIRARGI